MPKSDHPRHGMTARHEGPLGNLGPATTWCLGAGIGEPPDSSPSKDDFEREFGTIVDEGLAPVALRAIDGRPEHQGQPYLKSLRAITLSMEMRSMAAAAAGSYLLSEYTNEAIPFAVIKGPATARLYPPGWPRPYSDIDIILSSSNFHRAIDVAAGLGFAIPKSSLPQRSWFDLVCREGLNLHNTSGGNIDIHHHVAPWKFGTGLSAESVIRRSEPQYVCSVAAKFARPEDLLVISALHILNDLWKGKHGLVAWRDVLFLTIHLGPSRAQEAFDDVRLSWLYELIAIEIGCVLPAIGSVALPQRGKVSIPRGRLAALGWGNNSAATRHRLAWAARLPPSNAVAFLWGTVVPSRSYIRARHGSYRTYWRRGVQETISTARGSDYRVTSVDEYD
jgi:Uncharacterised nucleotidyltransferase